MKRQMMYCLTAAALVTGLSSVARAGGGRVSTVHIDPILFGLGVGYRF